MANFRSRNSRTLERACDARDPMGGWRLMSEDFASCNVTTTSFSNLNLQIRIQMRVSSSGIWRSFAIGAKQVYVHATASCSCPELLLERSSSSASPLV